MRLKVLTFNIRYDNPGDGVHAWPRRRSRMAEFLRGSQADLIALQEVLPSQRSDLEADLPEYRSYGVPRDGGGQGEQCLWLLRDPWWISEARTFWLSDTPETPGPGWDARLPRVCSWMRVQSPAGSVCVANLHLDHEGKEARRRGLDLVVSRTERPGLIVGDFNQSGLWDHLQGWTDLQARAGLAARGTWHDFRGGTTGERIDAILATPEWQLLPSGFGVGEDPDLSDHYPLWAAIEAADASR